MLESANYFFFILNTCTREGPELFYNLDLHGSEDGYEGRPGVVPRGHLSN